MKSLLLFGFLMIAASTQAQFHSPALDPNCYFPSLTDTSQTQVRYGTKKNQQLGIGLMNIGPAPGEDYSRLLIGNFPQSSVFLSAVRTGPSFDLNNLSVQGIPHIPRPDAWPPGVDWAPVATGHFHSKDRTDLLLTSSFVGYEILWADSLGLYDTARYTILSSKDGTLVEPFYFAHITSDTVDDIIGGEVYRHFNDGASSGGLFGLYQGGESLYEKGLIANPDSTLDFAHQGDSLMFGGMQPISLVGDFRGTGRTDLVLVTDTSIMFFPNDPPFTMEKFRHALLHDTLASYRNVTGGNLRLGLRALAAFPALPHTTKDYSVDLLLSWDSQSKNDGTIRIFRGGPDFGTHQLNLNQPDYVFHHPYDYDPNLDGTRFGLLQDCGDMTGTGNHVLFAPIAGQGSALLLFYVMGNAIDDKIDMFLSIPNGGGSSDTITANADRLQDLVLGLPYVNDTLDQSRTSEGMLAVIYGSDKIPVHLSKVVEQAERNQTALLVQPNPVTDHAVLTWQPNDAGVIDIRLVDILGRVVYSTKRQSTGELESFRLNFPLLAAGNYELELVQGSSVSRAMIVVD